ncbi:hypothetical protein [Streptomyces sp. IB201691-2A2]|uniref:hypothetical protein n=1 Tax=Streptomyces sp. IB201691-2A2 TaxID=2561920 RepID=UPI001180A4FA|nr:hypothetical protein [Streptomyces sp. IB201691-2A2]TRO56312.1 hypothetical protein E4K73_46880 [Streptomyces sp. IB201691-2A2]
MDLSTLIAAIAAAVASIAVARWEWFDRPQHGWNVHMTRDRWNEGSPSETGEPVERRIRVTFSVQAVGTAVVHSVGVRTPGALAVGPPQKDESVDEAEARRSLYQPTMSSGSKPIEFDVFFPNTGTVYIEIVWVRLRPYQMLGERVDARALADGEFPDWERWQWSWRSLRPRSMTAEGQWWMVWPVRTAGRWVPSSGRSRIEIPDTRLP